MEKAIQLYYSELQLSESGIDEIEGLEKLFNLRKLYLNKNLITELKGLENLINLEVLDLSFNNITEIKGLDNLSKLKYLNLSCNKITEIKGLENLINLEKLDLSFNKITEIQNLDNLANLTRLNIYDNPILDLKGLNNLKNLTRLEIFTLNQKIYWNRIPDTVNIMYFVSKYCYSNYDIQKERILFKGQEILKLLIIKNAILNYIKYKRQFYPDSDYVLNVLKPRFEELKK